MKNKKNDFIGHAAWLLLSIALTISLLGFNAGMFFAAKPDSRYLMLCLAFTTATMVFWGVVYSKNKEQELQEQKHLNDMILDELEFKRNERSRFFVNTELYIETMIKLSDLCYQKYRKKLYYNFLLTVDSARPRFPLISKSIFLKKIWGNEEIEKAHLDFKNAQKDYRNVSDKKMELWAEILKGVELYQIGGHEELEILRNKSQEIAVLWDKSNELANKQIPQKEKEIAHRGDYTYLYRALDEIDSLNNQAENLFIDLENIARKLQETVKR